MKIKLILLAGAVGIGVGVLLLPDRPEGPPRGVFTVTETGATPGTPRPEVPVGAASIPLDSSATGGATPVAQSSAAPADYVYWEVGDPGVWATPAQFKKAG